MRPPSLMEQPSEHSSLSLSAHGARVPLDMATMTSPHVGVRPFHQKSTCPPYVVQIWSCPPPKLASPKTCVLHRVGMIFYQRLAASVASQSTPPPTLSAVAHASRWIWSNGPPQDLLSNTYLTTDPAKVSLILTVKHYCGVMLFIVLKQLHQLLHNKPRPPPSLQWRTGRWSHLTWTGSAQR